MSTSHDFSSQENQLRKIANKRLLELLKDPNADVPPGQLMAFVAKVGFRVEPEKVERTQIQTANVLQILPGLPADRQQQIVEGWKKQINEAEKLMNKELPSG